MTLVLRQADSGVALGSGLSGTGTAFYNRQRPRPDAATAQA
jgi:hypothetical protein